jgi:hypothetical protein
MKKIFASALLASLFCTGAMATEVFMTPDPGQAKGTTNGFSYDNLMSIGGTPFMFNGGDGTKLTYDAGAFNYGGATLNFTPWDLGGSGSIGWDASPYSVFMTFKDVSGHIIGTDTLDMHFTGLNQTFLKKVYGVHEIDFSLAAGEQRTPRLFSLDVSPVPEPETYGMLIAGLAALGLIARRNKAA